MTFKLVAVSLPITTRILVVGSQRVKRVNVLTCSSEFVMHEFGHYLITFQKEKILKAVVFLKSLKVL